jgi:hypothetical protein
MPAPDRTLELLDRLQALGFPDQAFAHLHHSRARGWRGLISAHRRYCARVGEFQADGDNHRVERRLELVLNAYEHGGFGSRRAEVFVALADAAFAEIPPFRGAPLELASPRRRRPSRAPADRSTLVPR